MKNSKKIAINSTIEGFVKSSIGLIPVVGSFMNEAIFEVGGRIRQERVNTFCELLTEHFESVSEDEFNIHELQSEDFHDIFVAILKRVVETKSRHKLKRFKEILVKELKSPGQFDFTDTFLDLTVRLNENQILILAAFERVKMRQENLMQRMNRVKSDKLQRVEDRIRENEGMGAIDEFGEARRDAMLLEEVAEELHVIDEEISAQQLKIADDEYLFCVTDLESKSLLADITRTKINDQVDFLEKNSRFMISKFGAQYLSFISEAE